MRKWVCAGTNVVLLAGVIGLLLKFVVLGQTTQMADGRQAIELTEGQRDLVLAEMRGFLAGVQTITRAVADEDMALVAKTARDLGMRTAQDMPGPLVGRLPVEFKQLGFSVHQDFDALALDADAMGEPKMALASLSQTLNKCVACHASYRITAVSQ